MKIVIRAGGTGTRLWPMSRVAHPKQFQKIVGDSTMLRTTYERIAPMLKAAGDLFISVNHLLEEDARAEFPELPAKNLIIESESRNTGPAMCLEVAYLEKYCGKKDVIASLPSDDYISDSAAFRDLLLLAEQFIENHPDYILTPGIKPNYADTGYSYLRAGKNLQKIGEEAVYEVSDWVEKPNQEYCEELIRTGVYYYHTGMYIWQLGHIIDLFEKHQPAMMEACREIVKIRSKGDGFQDSDDRYSQLEKITIESAITDKADKIAMSVSNRIGWSDLGKWHVIKRVLAPTRKSNTSKGMVVSEKTSNSLIYCLNPKKLVVTNCIEELAIVDTGDVLFVSSLKDSADIKKILDRLREEGLEDYL
jgi:mannose-1-phosphate guanylyltransferase